MRLLWAETVRLLTRRSTWMVAVVPLAAAGAALAASVTPAGAVAGDRVAGFTTLLAGYLALVGYAAGAAWIGADLARGGTAALLLWQPRRQAVLGAKLSVLVAAILSLAAVTVGAYLGVLAVLGDLPSTPGPGALAPDPVWLGVRGVALAAAAAVLGFAVACLAGRTSTALGVLAAYLAVWELGGRSFLDSAGGWQARWFLLGHVSGWLDGGISEITIGWAGTVLGATVAVTLAAAFVGFAHRDVN